MCRLYMRPWAFGLLFLSFLIFSKNVFGQVDTVPPVLVCKQFVEVYLQHSPVCGVEVFVSDVIESLSDDQTSTDELELDFCFLNSCHPNVYQKCRDSVSVAQDTVAFLNANSFGTNHVSVFAKDNAGNTSNCQLIFSLQDNFGSCDPILGHYMLSGWIEHSSNQDKIGLQNINTTLTVSDAFWPLANGNFTIQSMTLGAYEYWVSSYANVRIHPNKNDDPINGVNTYDLLLIQKHLLGTEPLSNPYKIIAADVNNSGSITPTDITELRKLILGIYPDTLPNINSWRFTPKSFTFTNPLNPFLDSIPNSITIDTLFNCVSDLDFEATKIGDLNDDATYNVQTVDDRTRLTFSLKTKDKAFKTGEIVKFSFEEVRNLVAFQFSLEHDGLEFLDISSQNIESALEVFEFEEKNMLTGSSLSGNMDFSLRFKAIKDGKLSDLVAFTDEVTESLAFYEGGAMARLVLDFENAVKVKDGFENVQIHPNPFVRECTLHFDLGKDAAVLIEVFDPIGRMFFSKKIKGNQGHNQVRLSTLDVPSGMSFLKIQRVDGKHDLLKIIRL